MSSSYRGFLGTSATRTGIADRPMRASSVWCAIRKRVDRVGGASPPPPHRADGSTSRHHRGAMGATPSRRHLAPSHRGCVAPRRNAAHVADGGACRLDLARPRRCVARQRGAAMGGRGRPRVSPGGVLDATRTTAAASLAGTPHDNDLGGGRLRHDARCPDVQRDQSDHRLRRHSSAKGSGILDRPLDTSTPHLGAHAHETPGRPWRLGSAGHEAAPHPATGLRRRILPGA